MANIKFSKKLFEKEIGKLTDEMKNKISMFGTSFEGECGDEIEIEIFPNRPDMLSYEGFKRGFLAFLGKKTGLKKYKMKKPEKDYKVIIDKSVEKVRPHTACAIVKGISLDDNKIKELVDIQEKLHFTIGRKRKKVAIGIYPLEKIKLPITFKALEPDKIKFIPLESEREMTGFQILQRHSTGKDYAHLLAGMPVYPIFIDADKNILSMPPIINSQHTGKITEKTKNMFIECSGFDLPVLQKCLNILITALAGMGGKIFQMEIDYGKKKELSPNLNSNKMKISRDNVNKLLGLNLTEKQIREFLERMGHDYKNGVVEVPAWRTDILHEVDLIEDIAIAFGYDNFEPVIPKVSTIGEESSTEVYKRKIGEILAGLNMLEVSNYHLTTKKDQIEKIKMSEQKKKERFIEVDDSKTEYKILRKDLSHYLLKNFSENVDSEYPQRIFEVGKVFDLKLNDEILESENLCIGITPGNFTELKQVLNYLGSMLGVKFEFREDDNVECFIKGRLAKIILNGKEIGRIGEVHPMILRNFKIKMPVALCEICLEELFKNLD